MTNFFLPVYFLAIRDGWISGMAGPDLPCALAFGNLDEAQKAAEMYAEKQGEPLAMYRILEYRFTGNVSEA